MQEFPIIMPWKRSVPGRQSSSFAACRDVGIAPRVDSSQTDTEKQDAITTSYEQLFEANADMIGWLNIPGTQIDYPVMQTLEDEEYYLRRNFYKEKDKNGCLLMDTDSDTIWLVQI